ncbi:hypothetical protein VTO42DRAFT_5360 [Malbranchea cinnamomea]
MYPTQLLSRLSWGDCVHHRSSPTRCFVPDMFDLACHAANVLLLIMIADLGASTHPYGLCALRSLENQSRKCPRSSGSAYIFPFDSVTFRRCSLSMDMIHLALDHGIFTRVANLGAYQFTFHSSAREPSCSHFEGDGKGLYLVYYILRFPSSRIEQVR